MANSFDTEAFALLGVGLVVIGVRTYARIGAVGALHLAVDDYLMLLAAVSKSCFLPHFVVLQRSNLRSSRGR